MQAQDYVNYFRVLTSEPLNTGRWSDSDVMMLVNQARVSINMELDFPAGTIIATTVPGQQEYTLPSICRIIRGKLAGQILVETTIDKLEGTQLEIYDASNPAAWGTPQWNSAPPDTYPQQDVFFGGQFSNSLPFYQGQRAEYYMRDNSGVIGIVPPPIGAYPLALNIVPFPNQFVNLTDTDQLYDQHFKELITQGAVKRAYQSDRDSEARMLAAQNEAEELKRVRAWIDNIFPGNSHGPIMRTYRSLYKTQTRNYGG